MNLSDRPALDQLLLNDWQRDFPLSETPFAGVALRCGSDETTVLATYRRLLKEGSVSRIGGIWGAGVGGAAMLCALSVPEAQLARVAERVNAIEGVNHNYEREHDYNLWFVITGRDRDTVHAQVNHLEDTTGLKALRLPMVRPYRIDLGFDLRQTRQSPHPGEAHPAQRQRGTPVAVADERLAALVEEGLPIMSRPYDAWAEALGWSTERIRQTLTRWLAQGTLRRFGVVVRHHDLGISANAMTVLDVPNELVDAAGARLAAQPGVTLCYRRERHRDWSYNLYFMVHGQDRAAVNDLIAHAISQAGLGEYPCKTLFSGTRFKQTGGRYFRALANTAPSEAAHEQAA